MRSAPRAFAALVVVIVSAALELGVWAQTTSPTTEPSDEIFTGRLQNPLKLQSWCYLDLETGQVFARGEIDSPDMVDMHRRIGAKNVDVMCETREPVKGLVAYDLALHETTDGIVFPRELGAVKEELKAIESKRMDFINACESSPRTFLFRTRDGEHGVLEIGPCAEGDSGIRLRYRLLHPPPKPIPAAVLMANYERYNQLLKRVRRPVGVQPAWVNEFAEQEALLGQMCALQREPDSEFAAIQTQLIMKKYELEQLRERLPPDATQLLACERKVATLQNVVDERTPKIPHVQGVTPMQLLPRVPATAPAGR